MLFVKSQFSRADWSSSSLGVTGILHDFLEMHLKVSRDACRHWPVWGLSLLLGVLQLVHLANPVSLFHFTASRELARNLVLSKQNKQTKILEHLNILLICSAYWFVITTYLGHVNTCYTGFSLLLKKKWFQNVGPKSFAFSQIGELG